MKILMLRKTIVAIILGASSYWLTIHLIAPIFPIYLVDLGASKAEVGFIVAIPSILSIFLRIPVASRVHSIGRFKFLGIALIISSISLIAYGLAKVIPAIYIARIIHSISIASFGPVALASISVLSSDEERAKIMSIYLTAVAVAMILGPILAGMLVALLNIPLTFTISGFMLIPISIMLISLGRYDKPYCSIKNGSNFSLRKGLKLLVSKWAYMLLCIATLSYSLTLGFFRAFFPIYAKEVYLLTASFVSFLYAVRACSNAVVRPILGALCRKIGSRIIMISGLLLVASSYYIFSLNLPLYAIIIAMALFGLGWAFYAVASIIYIGYAIESEYQDIAMALYFNIYDIGSVVGSTLGGIILYYLSYNMIWLTLSTLLVIGSLVLLAMHK